MAAIHEEDECSAIQGGSVSGISAGSNAASKNVLILPGNMGTKQSVHEDLMLLDGDCVIR